MRWLMPDQVARLVRMPRMVPTSPRPVEGSQPSQTEKIMMSIMPCQKFGRLKPRIDPVMTVSSSTVFRASGPAHRPSGMPMTSDRASATKASSRVAGMRLRIRSIEGWLNTKERPRSPCRAFQRKVPYCSMRGGRGRAPGSPAPARRASHPARSGSRSGLPIGVDAGEDDDRGDEEDEQALGQAADDEDGHAVAARPRRIRRRLIVRISPREIVNRVLLSDDPGPVRHSLESRRNRMSRADRVMTFWKCVEGGCGALHR